MTDVHDFFDRSGNLVNRHDDVVGQEYLALEFYRGLAVAAHIPNALVGFEDVYSSRFLTDRADFVHLGVQFVFLEGFDGDDDVNAVVVMGHVLVMAVVGTAADVRVVHVFDTGRIDTGFISLGTMCRALRGSV